ncbi:hypothetical protein BU16DRAFT_564396 [Lophium mytilinum]|uniref:RNA-dependent RNA polymerase n=1 Tax=Lophium mytilinum TaxID=390894 RepID=A0A6A6QHL8_9PEZI|nr:hypothetical protein BU16DRAFT_564396 [Lophium mytilinum]
MNLYGRVQTHQRDESGPQLPPNTPTKQRNKSGEAMEAIVRKLEDRWELGLSIRGPDWTPSTSRRGPTDEVYGMIKRLYWSAEPALHEIVDLFWANAPDKRYSPERLEYLRSLLVEKIGTKRKSDQEGPRNNPAKILRSPLSSQVFGDLTEVRDLTEVQNNDSYQSYVTALQTRSGTPTDDEDDQGVYISAPPSPSMDAMNRRSNATQKTPAQGSGASPRKRKSESFADESPSKASRSSSGRKSRMGPPESPYLPARVYSSGTLFPASSANTSANTSFATDVAEVFSQADPRDVETADTSFASDIYEDAVEDDAGGGEVNYPNLRVSSSATMGSLDDDELWMALEAVKDVEEILSQPLEDLSIHKDDPIVNKDHAGHLPRSVEGPNRLEVSEEGENSRHEPVRLETLAEAAVPSVQHVIDESTTTAQPANQVSPSRAANRSPKRFPIEQHQIRDLPRQGLFVDNDPLEWKDAPFHVRWECLRIAQELGLQPLEVMGHYVSQFSDYDMFLTGVILKLPDTPGLRKMEKPSRKMWLAAQDNFEGYTFSGKVGFNETNIGSLFKLSLEPLQKLQSCRFQRAFGSDRLLYLTMPSPHNIPKTMSRIKDQEKSLRARFVEWLRGTDHSLLGRTWRAFHVEEKADKKSVRENRTFQYRVVLFATSGTDIRSESAEYDPRRHSLRPEFTIDGFLDWFMSFEENLGQKFCKAYARIDLGLSRTAPTIVFRPSQVRFVADTFADGSPEDSTFNDPRLEWPENDGVDPSKPPVMNDGCALISLGAMREIWRMQGKAGPVPSFCQARIGGAKGIWIASASSTTTNPAHRDIWIEITESQLKFNPHREDLNDDTYDSNRLTFEVVKFGTSVVNSELHLAFIPIMLDRGVPQATLIKLMNDRLDFERAELLQAVESPKTLRTWLNKQQAREEERQRDGDMLWQASMPLRLPEKLVFLLESGFSPAVSQYLADQTHRFLGYVLRDMKRNLRLPVGKAVNLIGIADPYGVLKPGEVHVNFSSNFIDEMTGESYTRLDGIDVLVGRQPSLRRSDMQRVRAVCKPELEHLVDVIVFPSRGSFPLAGKLQGGDYDGDIFWTCWEPELVKPFLNAPAPTTSPSAEGYKMKVDRRTLKDVLGSGPQRDVESYLAKSFEFRSAQTFLGRVKNFHEKLCYFENTIDSPGINLLSDIHDLIIDAAKNGIIVDEDWFYELISDPRIRSRNPKNPAYKAAMKDNWGKPKMGEKPKTYVYDASKPLDYLYFRVLSPHLDKTLSLIEESWTTSTCEDPHLMAAYDKEMAGQHEDELKLLRTKFAELYSTWVVRTKKMDGHDRKADDYNLAIEDCYEIYESILPSESAPSYWVEEDIPGRTPYWKLLKASALHNFQGKHTTFTYHCAGRELALTKAYASGRYRVLTEAMYGLLKPKKAKALTRDAGVPRGGEMAEYDDAPDDFEE